MEKTVFKLEVMDLALQADMGRLVLVEDIIVKVQQEVMDQLHILIKVECGVEIQNGIEIFLVQEEQQELEAKYIIKIQIK